MSRKGSHPARVVLPDPKHGSQLIARFINMVMKSGKKSVAESIVYGALQHISEKHGEPVQLVEKVAEVKPVEAAPEGADRFVEHVGHAAAR